MSVSLPNLGAKSMCKNHRKIRSFLLIRFLTDSLDISDCPPLGGGKLRIFIRRSLTGGGEIIRTIYIYQLLTTFTL
jgi:hypothetical protein